MIIFDFDGTLVNTIVDVGICFNQALKANGYPAHPLEHIETLAGGTLDRIVQKLLPHGKASPENVELVKLSYQDLYLKSEKPHTKPYDGIVQVLKNCAESGYQTAVNSNKKQHLLEDMVTKQFPSHVFDAVVGYQELCPPKPDPWGVNHICDICGCPVARCVYVGDNQSDIDTAANAGIPCIFVEWGQGSADARSDPRIWKTVSNAGQLWQKIREAEM